MVTILNTWSEKICNVVKSLDLDHVLNVYPANLCRICSSCKILVKFIQLQRWKGGFMGYQISFLFIRQLSFEVFCWIMNFSTHQFVWHRWALMFLSYGFSTLFTWSTYHPTHVYCRLLCWFVNGRVVNCCLLCWFAHLITLQANSYASVNMPSTPIP